MDVREKLVELLKTNACPSPFMYDKACKYYGYGDCFPDRFADHLIANGVTVQEWVSVYDRFPEPFVSVLVHMPGEKPFTTVREGFISNDGIWQSAMFCREPGEVTYWQPMPQPPKGDVHNE